jgi:hypothetical protein
MVIPMGFDLAMASANASWNGDGDAGAASGAIEERITSDGQLGTWNDDSLSRRVLRQLRSRSSRSTTVSREKEQLDTAGRCASITNNDLKNPCSYTI